MYQTDDILVTSLSDRETARTLQIPGVTAASGGQKTQDAMLDLISSNPMLHMLDRSMSLANHRLGLIASNLANIDTPGYKTRDFSFQEALKAELGGAQGGSGVTMARTHPGHLGGGAGSGGTGAGKGINPAFERNDGNSVNLDQQTMALARTQGQYTLAASFAQVELRRIYQAIREGAK